MADEPPAEKPAVAPAAEEDPHESAPAMSAYNDLKWGPYSIKLDSETHVTLKNFSAVEQAADSAEEDDAAADAEAEQAASNAMIAEVDAEIAKLLAGESVAADEKVAAAAEAANAASRAAEEKAAAALRAKRDRSNALAKGAELAVVSAAEARAATRQVQGAHLHCHVST